MLLVLLLIFLQVSPDVLRNFRERHYLLPDLLSQLVDLVELVADLLQLHLIAEG